MAEFTRVFWFSGTGNSFHVARAISDGLSTTDPRPVTDRGPVNMSSATRVFLVCPVYSWGFPRAVQRFVRRLPGQKISSATVILTHGSAPGGAAAVAAREFSRVGVTRVNVYTIRMVENYPPFGGAPEREKIDTLLRTAEKRLSDIIKDVGEGKSHPPSFGSRMLMIPSMLMNRLFQKSLRRSDRKFSVTDACDSCGTCVAVCPVMNIYLERGKPVWKGKCEQCFACFHWCPQRAILYGPRTARQNRYHHPAVSQQQIAGSAVDGKNE